MKRLFSLLLVVLAFAPGAGAQSGRTFSQDGIRTSENPAGPVLRAAMPTVRLQPVFTAGPDAALWASRLTGVAPGFASGKGNAAFAKLDATARLLLGARAGLGKNAAALASAVPEAAVHVDGSAVFVDVMADLAPGASLAALEALGAAVQARVGNLVALRVPLDALEALAARTDVREIETSRRRRPAMAASRADIRADLVHAGVGLPGPVQGEGVVVGVLDSGLDVTHPDFFNEGGSRVQFLRELKAGNAQADWTKAQIDAGPAAVSERDGNGGGGHGTHVAGTAAGGGRADASMRGIAPRADIVFVKGVRDADSDGGFSDNDIVAGTQFIFARAAALGKPAVVNLSLGSNGGPLDGTGLLDRMLSDLVGPGRLIVVAGGNEGFDLLHAGGTTVPGQFNQTMLLVPEKTTFSQADIWYEQGAVTDVGLVAYYIENQTLKQGAFSGWMPIGNAHANWQPFVQDGQTIAEYAIDAATTRDAGNGDGNAAVYIRSTAQADASNWIWGIVTKGTKADRVDLWAGNGEFVNFGFNLQGFTEMVGNTDQTLGTPASGDKIIAVASYVTTNTWTNIDGNRYEAVNPSPSRDGTGVTPVLGQRSYFSSIGPRRDGRAKPEIAAPGERIFSARSSHLTEGVGVRRENLFAGGQYLATQGTSMASPHVAGVVALMLQVNPTLDYAAALDILQKTARTADTHTGVLPNVQWGAGRVDALAAVQEALRRAGGNPGGGVQRATLSRFDAAGQQRNFTLDDAFPVDSGFVAGTNRYGDRAKATLFNLPANVTTAEVTEVNVWFGYKQPGVSRKYAIEIYPAVNGAPAATSVFRQEFDLSHAQADALFTTPEAPTAHTLSAPVRVNGPFYVAVDFGSYPAQVGQVAGALAIVHTAPASARVPHVWEKWADGTWHNLSDAWWGNNGAPGTDGVDLWIQAGVQYATATPVEEDVQPEALSLRLAGPNPFRESTALAYGVPQTGRVTVEVYDLLGRRVATLVDGIQPAGTYTVAFAPASLASGLYVARLQAGGQTRVQRLVRAE